jgi:amino acid transporter
MSSSMQGKMQRSVGFYGLMFVSLGSIIGSGWLLGALKAASRAGPASILSWILAALMLSSLALTFAELGAAYPVAGGAARFPQYSHGPIAGFIAGWASWLQAVFIAPIEVLAALTYINSVEWVHTNFNMLNDGLLNGRGVLVSVAMMVLFLTVNLAGARFLSDSNTIVVIWKVFVPVLAVFVIGGMRFNTSNFSAGGGFMPHGFHGVFAALTGGVVFALQGFEQAAQLAGEAKNPKRDLSRSILVAMLIGAVLYAALQLVMIAAIDPKDIASGWDNPLGTKSSAYGAWYTLALAVGVGWLAKMLLVDAVISPAGTGVVYLGTTARLSYALGAMPELPKALAKTNAKGIPLFSTLLAFVVGCVAFGPFKSWLALVEVVTGATAIMYSFAPISLAALHRLDPDRPRAYRVPMPSFVLRAAFCSANLIIYWSGFETTWKLIAAMGVGFVFFALGASRKQTGAMKYARNTAWLSLWFIGHLLMGYAGNYGGGEHWIPEWVDIALVVGFALGIFELALRQSLSAQDSAAAIATDAHQLDFNEKA